MLGNPKYNLGEMVIFSFGDEGTKIGKIIIVDAFGTFEQTEEVSYDIYVENERCIYKHIRESSVVEKV